HEALLHILRAFRIDPSNPAHLIAMAKQGMRHFLVDQARKRQADKRGGAQHDVPITDEAAPDHEIDSVAAAIKDAVDRLTAENKRLGEVARLHLIQALSLEETAEALGVSRTT